MTIWEAKKEDVLLRAEDAINSSWKDGERKGYLAGVEAMLRGSIFFDCKTGIKFSIAYINACLVAKAEQLSETLKESKK